MPCDNGVIICDGGSAKSITMIYDIIGCDVREQGSYSFEDDDALSCFSTISYSCDVMRWRTVSHVLNLVGKLSYRTCFFVDLHGTLVDGTKSEVEDSFVPSGHTLCSDILCSRVRPKEFVC